MVKDKQWYEPRDEATSGINTSEAHTLLKKYYQTTEQEFEEELSYIENSHIKRCLEIIWEGIHKPSPTDIVDEHFK